MAEYIKREDVLKFPIRKDCYDKENGNEYFIFGIESVMEFIADLPAADVAPVVHGKLKYVEKKIRYCYCAICSVCGRCVEAWDFCSSCGAKMEMDGQSTI